MQVLDPDILILTRQLSPAVSAVAILVGLALWLFGAHSHHFWLALLMTVSAGLVGLVLGREFAVQPLVAGLLLALAAGMLGPGPDAHHPVHPRRAVRHPLVAHRRARRQRVPLLRRRRARRRLLLPAVDHRPVEPLGTVLTAYGSSACSTASRSSTASRGPPRTPPSSTGR